MVLAVLTVLFFSFLFSGTEAALLSLPAGEKLSPAAQRVSDAMKSTLCSLVLGNNLANIAGSIALGQLAAYELPAWAQGVFPWVFTVLVIVFGEIIPKAIGEARSVQVIGFMARVLLALNWVFTPVNAGFEFILSYLPQKEVVEDEEELVEAARSLDTTPVSAMMLKAPPALEYAPDQNAAMDLAEDWSKFWDRVPEGEEGEYPKLFSGVMSDVAVKTLQKEGPLVIIDDRGKVVGLIDHRQVVDVMFDHH